MNDWKEDRKRGLEAIEKQTGETPLGLQKDRDQTMSEFRLVPLMLGDKQVGEIEVQTSNDGTEVVVGTAIITDTVACAPFFPIKDVYNKTNHFSISEE